MCIRDRLQAVRHRHPVRLDQDVAGQPGVQVHVLHGGDLVHVGGLRVQVRGDRGVWLGRVPHQPRLLLRVEDPRVAVVALLDRGGAALQERAALHPLGQHVREMLEAALHAARQAVDAGQRQRLAVDRVAAEQLVRALAGEHHRDVPGSGPGQEVERDQRRVGHRVVQQLHDPWQLGEHLLVADHGRGQRDAEPARGVLRDVDLGVAVRGEPGGERVDARLRLRRQRRHRGRVDAAGQERADRDVGVQVLADTGPQRVPDRLVGDLRLQAQRPQRGPEPAVLADPAAGRPHQAVPRREAADVPVQGERVRHVLEGQVVPDRVPVQRGAGRGGERVQGLALAGQPQPVRRLQQVERLDPERVPGRVHGAGAVVVGDEREHAAQPGQRRLAPVVERRRQHLGVTLGRERGVVLADQLGAQLAIVVDLAVEHHRPAVGVVQRLRRVVPVDDREPVEAERVPVAVLDPGVVRTPVPHALQRRGERRRRRLVHRPGLGSAAEVGTQTTHRGPPRSEVRGGDRRFSL